MALAFLAFLSGTLSLWQWLVALRFPLHRRTPSKPFPASVTLLKPLKGLDDNTIHCLKSWLTSAQAAANPHQPVQILFGVASPDDPVCPAIGRLLKEHPHCDAQLVICPEHLGVNAKVSTLIQLSRLAEGQIIVVSDADVLVPPDFLQNVVTPLQDPEVGLVNCFYRFANPSNAAMRWEAIATNADFWSQVLQGASMQPLDFALGAVMAARRETLSQIGGFESLADFLADDFQLGNRIVRIANKRIALCPVVVDCLSHSMSWSEAWAHQLRWARTIRVCKPLPYAASIISNATFWPLLWFALQPTTWSALTLIACLLLRIVSAQILQARLGPTPGQHRYWWLVPFKDLLQVALWAAAIVGNHITWRGQRFHLLPDGRLHRNPS